MKQTLVRLLRFLRLLPAVDYFRYLLAVLRNRRSNQLFRLKHREFPVPPYSLAYDAYANTNWNEYHDSGASQARLLAELVKKELKQEEIKILEWGCGPARVIRHIQDALRPARAEVHGTDYNPRTVKWCQENITTAEFRKNQLAPPLPFEAGWFDCIYSISVFTHLSLENHLAWFDELDRVTKPGGVLIFTTHGDHCRSRLLKHEKESYDSGRLVTRGYIREGKRCFVAYHPPSFVREQLLQRRFKIREHIANPSVFFQDIWVAAKG